MIPWCRGAVDSTLYFSQKTGRQDTTREFSIDKYREWILQQVAEHTTSCSERDDIAQHYQELLDNGVDFCTEREAYQSLHAEDDHEVDVFWRDWNRQFLVKRDAIRWFVMNYVEPTTEGGGV